MRRIALALSLACAAPLAAQAQSCDAPHAVRDGETIFSIAEVVYGDPEKWTLLFYSNEDLLRSRNFQIAAGDTLFIPCEAGSQAADATPLQRDDAEMKLVTGSNYAPFTDRNWPGPGLITDLVNAALVETPDPVSYSIAWEDDWSKHLFPLLDDKTFDMGFPWLKPDCDQTPDDERCANFHFSDPLMEILVLLFVRADQGFDYQDDQDVIGKRLCRPAGYFTHDLDRPGREWLRKGLIQLVQEPSPQACFQALMEGRVDAVTVNIFLGADTIDAMGLRGQVVPLDKPLSVEGLHVVISKRHWRGTTHLYRFNAGLAALKDSDRYAQIVSRHLGIFWDRLQAE